MPVATPSTEYLELDIQFVKYMTQAVCLVIQVIRT